LQQEHTRLLKVFDHAQYNIYLLMKSDPFPRFLSTQTFKDLEKKFRREQMRARGHGSPASSTVTSTPILSTSINGTPNSKTVSSLLASNTSSDPSIRNIGDGKISDTFSSRVPRELVGKMSQTQTQTQTGSNRNQVKRKKKKHPLSSFAAALGYKGQSPPVTSESVLSLVEKEMQSSRYQVVDNEQNDGDV